MTPLSDWTLAGGLLAERNQLVILIALGESILAAGATFSELDSSAKALASLVLGFLGPVSLWWVYFVRYEPDGDELIEHAPEATNLGRNGFAYAHGMMVARSS
jgi:low temperature requirement protein LtrA